MRSKYETVSISSASDSWVQCMTFELHVHVWCIYMYMYLRTTTAHGMES
jgi:hypothetical protein